MVGSHKMRESRVEESNGAIAAPRPQLPPMCCALGQEGPCQGHGLCQQRMRGDPPRIQIMMLGDTQAGIIIPGILWFESCRTPNLIIRL